MTTANFVLLITLLGLLSVTLIDTIGSVLSRVLKFNYAWFAILSFIVYIGVPYILSDKVSFEIALAANLLIGLYDSTIGAMVSKKLKANVGADYETNPVSVYMRILIMLFTAFICGYLGYVVGSN